MKDRAILLLVWGKLNVEEMSYLRSALVYSGKDSVDVEVMGELFNVRYNDNGYDVVIDKAIEVVKMKDYTAICIDLLNKVDTYDFKAENLEKAREQFLTTRILASGYDSIRILETTGSTGLEYEEIYEMYESRDKIKMSFMVESHIDHEKEIFK